MSSLLTINPKNWLKNHPTSYSIILDKELKNWARKGCFSPSQHKSLSQLLQHKVAEKLAKKQQQVSKSQLEDLARTYCNDLYDLQLLKDSNPTLVYKYQAQTIRIINEHLRRYGNTSSEHLRKQLLQEVNDQLILKLAQGRLKNFKGQSLFKTFFYRVTVFTLKDIFRSLRRHQTEELHDEVAIRPKTPSVSPTIFRTQMYRLIPKHQISKFEFSIRVIYRLPITPNTMQKLYPNASKEALNYVATHFQNNYAERSKCTIWNQLLQAIILLENKQQGLRSLQEWIKKNRIKLVEKLLQKNILLQTATQKNAFDTYFEWLVYQSLSSNLRI